MLNWKLCVKGSRRGLIWSAAPAFSLQDWGKPLVTWVKTVDLQAEIWTQQLPNIK
jgi:hypothetical protein